MIGAVLGDIIGSPYEFDFNNIKTKEFNLFSDRSEFTDDTVMTMAVAEGLMNGYRDPEKSEQEIIKSMRRLGRLYPDAGYGARFSCWLISDNPQPYNSYGNGSAMRVSSAAWLYNTLDDVEKYAALSAEVTHNHPEGIKGAQATAAAVFMARTGSSKADIKSYIEESYGYNLSRTCDEIRPSYHHVESCQETVPEAIIAFLEGSSFEDVIRTAVSLGGDSDTLAAIAGSIAEGFYGVPQKLKRVAVTMLDDELNAVYSRFESMIAAAAAQAEEKANCRL